MGQLISGGQAAERGTRSIALHVGHSRPSGSASIGFETNHRTHFACILSMLKWPKLAPRASLHLAKPDRSLPADAAPHPWSGAFRSASGLAFFTYGANKSMGNWIALNWTP